MYKPRNHRLIFNLVCVTSYYGTSLAQHISRGASKILSHPQRLRREGKSAERGDCRRRQREYARTHFAERILPPKTLFWASAEEKVVNL